MSEAPRTAISEEKNKSLLNDWYAEAEKIKTPAELADFVTRLTTLYEHDYGTICHAVTAVALAGARTVNRSPQGGITGFQASCVMWEFIQRWQGIEGPARLIQYDDMLYPQSAEKFALTIKPETAERLKTKATENLRDTKHAHPDVVAHWKRMAEGWLPFGFKVAP